MFSSREGCSLQEGVVGFPGVVFDCGLDGAAASVAQVSMWTGDPVLLIGLDVVEVGVYEARATPKGPVVPSGRLPGPVEGDDADLGRPLVRIVAGLQLHEHDSVRHWVSMTTVAISMHISARPRSHRQRQGRALSRTISQSS